MKAGPGIKFQEGAYRDVGSHPKTTSNVLYTRQSYNKELGQKSNIDRLKDGLFNLIRQKQEMNELRVKMEASQPSLKTTSITQPSSPSPVLAKRGEGGMVQSPDFKTQMFVKNFTKSQ